MVELFSELTVLGHENFKIWAQEDRIPELTYAAQIGHKVGDLTQVLKYLILR